MCSAENHDLDEDRYMTKRSFSRERSHLLGGSNEFKNKYGIQEEEVETVKQLLQFCSDTAKFSKTISRVVTMY